jgi:hypothetical protein
VVRPDADTSLPGDVSITQLRSNTIADWAYAAGAVHRLLESRKPVGLGDTIRPTGIVKSKQVTASSRRIEVDPCHLADFST